MLLAQILPTKKQPLKVKIELSIKVHGQSAFQCPLNTHSPISVDPTQCLDWLDLKVESNE